MFTTPLALLGLLALPAILAIHLFRRRYRPRAVSALFLWAAVGADPAAGRRREPLRRSASLLLELLAALLLALAMAGPRWGSGAGGGHLVAVIDGTVSMNAAGPDGATPLDRARASLGAALRDLPASTRVTLVRTGPSPAIVAGPAAFRLEAMAALDDWRSPFGGHDPGAAFDLATELARGSGAVYLTDRPGEASGGVRTVAFGTSRSNAGIVSLVRERAADGDRLQVVARSFAGVPRTLRLDIANAEAALGATEPFALDPGASVTRTLRVPRGAGAVTCTLIAAEPDPLDEDDVAVVGPLPRRELKVAADVDGDVALALGLGGAETAAARWAGVLDDARAVEDPRTAHLLLTDGPSTGEAWVLRVEATDSPEPAHFTSPFLLDRVHPLLGGVTLEGVVWTSGGGLDGSGRPLAYAGDAILIQESVLPAGRVEWRLDLDPARSTLGRSPDWPILLANAAEERRRALPGPERTTLALGEPFRVRGVAAGDERPWTLRGPGNANEREVIPVPGGDLVTRGLDRVGAWTLTSPDGAREYVAGVSLLSPVESDLEGAASSGDVDAAVAAVLAGSEGDASGGGQRWSTWLALLAMAVLAADWLVLSRGRR